ncbi:MAG: stage V sporulation protein T [Clostridia bacterium]|nr:stage V sporulation protein T [Clostridia bacterium]
MKATGIVRRIDDLGRVVIPKEIRRTMRIREGDPLEIYTEKDGEVIFKKYSPIGELGDFATEYAETLAKTSGYGACITDRDVIIAVSGVPKKELIEKRISPELESVIVEKNTYVNEGSNAKKITVAEGVDKYSAGVVAPIISEGDTIGSVIFFSQNDAPMGEVENKLAQSAANFLGRHMES